MDGWTDERWIDGWLAILFILISISVISARLEFLRYGTTFAAKFESVYLC